MHNNYKLICHLPLGLLIEDENWRLVTLEVGEEDEKAL
jgi:hypothetical protein